MFDFAYPHLLWLLWAIAVYGLLFWWARVSRMRNLRRFGQIHVMDHLMPEVSKYKPGIKIVLELVALISIIMVLARPRAGEVEKDTEINGI
ncbi:MAG: BatA domain-containing protein, partial [Muribaculaceae bacterium]|nr:BatA domain-containing protein [Muribaculaceae bacterium]